jgi:tetratricopeptide (TPR) repeat protein
MQCILSRSRLWKRRVCLTFLAMSMSGCTTLFDPKTREERISQDNNRAASFLKSGSYRDAEAAYLAGVEEARGSANPICLPDEMRNLANAYVAAGDYANAEKHMRGALTLYEKGDEEYKTDYAIALLFEQRISETQLDIANSLREQKNLDEAANWYRKVLLSISLSMQTNHRLQRKAFLDYAALLRMTGHSTEARRMEAQFDDLGSIVQDWKKLLAEGRRLAAQKCFDEEEKKLNEAYSIASSLGRSDPQYAALLVHLGMQDLSKGQLTSAFNFLDEARHKSYIAPQDRAVALTALGKHMELTGRGKEANSLYAEAMNLSPTSTVSTLDELSYMFAQRGNPKEVQVTQEMKRKLISNNQDLPTSSR